MTPLAGFVIAVIAAWIVRDPRRAAALVVVPYLAVVAAQTWAIDAGRGVSPPSTVWPFGPAISYYVVQAIILALSLAVAALLGAVRARRRPPSDRVAGIGRRTFIAATVDGVLTAAFITGALLATAPVRLHSVTGSPPLYGVIGIGVSIVSVIVLGVLLLTSRRRLVAASARGVAETSQAAARARSGSRTGAVIAAGAVGLLGVAGAAGAAPAKAAPVRSGGIVHIYESGIGGPTNHNVFTGFFTDYGVDHKDALDHGNVNKIVLSKGTFEANVRQLNARLTVVSSNTRACSIVVTSTAPVPLSHGTGKYKGIRGTLTVTVDNAVVFPRKANGKCDEVLSKALASITSVTGSGRVRF